MNCSHRMPLHWNTVHQTLIVRAHKNIMSSKADGPTSTLVCPICDDVIPSGSRQGLSQHRQRYCRARFSNAAKLVLKKRKKNSIGDGFAKSSAVVTKGKTHAQSKKEVISRNRRMGERAVSYSSNILWHRPNIKSQASTYTAKYRDEEFEEQLDDIKFDDLDYTAGYCEEEFEEQSDEDDAKLKFDDLGHEYKGFIELENKFQQALNVQADTSPDYNTAGNDDKEESNDVGAIDEGTWEDIYTMFPRRDKKIAELKREHKEKWAEYISGDGYEQGNEEFERPYEYKNNLPPYYIAQLSLMKILSQHRRVNAGLFDRILQWACWFSDKYPDIWSTRHKFKCHNRHMTLKMLADFFDLKHMIPHNNVVHMSDEQRVETIPTLSFRGVLKGLLLDKTIINDQNLIQDNFDKATWRPIKSYSQMGPSHVVNELCDGALYEQALDMYCNEKPPPGVDYILPIPLIGFCDESHLDNNNGNKTTPVAVTVAALNHDARSKYENWVHFGFIPYKEAGSGRNRDNYDDEWVLGGKKRGQKSKTKHSVKMKNAKDIQLRYAAVLSSFRDFCNKVGGFRFWYKGKRVLGKPFLLCMIGDTKEFNMMTGHYNSSGNRNTACLCKDCMCSFWELTQTPPKCTDITLADINYAMENEEYARRISQHQVLSAWNDIPLADYEMGIAGSTPPEVVHVLCQGLYMDGSKCIHDTIDPSKTAKQAEKEEIDLLFHHLRFDLSRNSERRKPEASGRHGVMDLSMLTAMEKRAAYLLCAMCAFTSRGQAVLKDPFKQRKVSLDKTVDTMCLLLSYEAWITGTAITKWEVENAHHAVSHLMQQLQKHLPLDIIDKVEGSKEGGSNGYHKPKFHFLFIMLKYLRKLGSLRGTSGQHGEAFHKESVKANGEQTQKRQYSFTAQVGQRDGESHVIAKSFPYIEHLCPPDLRHLYNTTQGELFGAVLGEVQQQNFTVRGKYTLQCPNGRRNFVHKWDDNNRNALNIGLDDTLLHTIATNAAKMEYEKSFTVHGYTELTVFNEHDHKTYYRANEYFNSRKWYDWALVSDPKVGTQYIANILGFIKYQPGYPTYKLIELDGHSARDIEVNNIRDDTLYVVIKAATDFTTEETLSRKILTRFKVQDKDEAYIYPVTCIKRCLAVVKDYGSPKSISYIHVLGQHKWGAIFSAKIRECAVGVAMNKVNGSRKRKGGTC